MAFNRMGAYKVIDLSQLQSSCIAIIDTSIIFLIAQNLLKYEELIEVLGNCTPILTLPTLNELTRLASKPTEKGRKATWILNNLLNKFIILDIGGTEQRYGDIVITEISKELSKKFDIVVVTADIKLKNELLKQGINVLWYRKAKKRLEPANILIKDVMKVKDR